MGENKKPSADLSIPTFSCFSLYAWKLLKSLLLATGANKREEIYVRGPIKYVFLCSFNAHHRDPTVQYIFLCCVDDKAFKTRRLVLIALCHLREVPPVQYYNWVGLSPVAKSSAKNYPIGYESFLALDGCPESGRGGEGRGAV